MTLLQEIKDNSIEVKLKTGKTLTVLLIDDATFIALKYATDNSLRKILEKVKEDEAFKGVITHGYPEYLNF